uniref:RING-type domain-containing protein n=1 Tax=viral metagenome TaxID=1070528 RepID=A0A6C0BPB1_9ZZZZ
MGASGTSYTVQPAQLQCTCPDFRTRHQFCKHLIFTFIRVFKFSEAETQSIAEVGLHEDQELPIIPISPSPSPSPCSIETSKECDPEDDCCICMEVFDQVETTQACQACGNFFHTDCVYRWLQASEHENCPLCRADWFDN